MDMQKELDSWVEKGVPYLIQDDVTCAHQYFEIHCSRNRLEPEKRLMLAVLQDALFCFQRYFCARDGRHRKSFWEAWQWFNEEGSDSIFAFENICEVLGLDISYVRRGLKLCEGLSGAFGRYKSAHLRVKDPFLETNSENNLTMPGIFPRTKQS
jgi:hypothetical protein